MELKLKFPILETKQSNNYALIMKDSDLKYHYFNFDGTYDGYSHEPNIDGETGTYLN